jgi:hypothetical protein
MWSRWFGAPGAHSGPLYSVSTTSGANSEMTSAIFARSFGVSKMLLSGKSQNSTCSTPTMAADRRCSISRRGPHFSGGMPSIPTSPRQASA